MTAPRVQILEHAAELTAGDRNKAYGDPGENHENIAALWSAWESIRTPQVDPAEDAMIRMALLKVARMVSPGVRLDTYADAAAYLAMAGERRLGFATSDADTSLDSEDDLPAMPSVAYVKPGVPMRHQLHEHGDQL